MNSNRSGKQLRISYRVRYAGDQMTVWISDPTALGLIPEQRPGWQRLQRVQWLSSWLKEDQLEQALLGDLSRSHPDALGLEIDQITVLRDK